VEGASLAEETVRGARLAADRGWLAPPMPEARPTCRHSRR
jgi:hypothetical protein